MNNDREPISHAYLRSDLRNIVTALLLAGGRGRTEYSEGYTDALMALAVALGMDLPAVRRTITIEQPGG